MRLLIIACVAVPLSAATAEPVELAGEEQRPVRSAQMYAKQLCPTPLMHDAEPPPKAEFKKLTELPPADAFHAVYRRDDQGCIDPVMVGYQYGRGR